MNLKQGASEDNFLMRNKRSKYEPVNNDIREKLIYMVDTEKYRLKKAAEALKMNYNTAKTILRIWKKESRFKKKKKKKNFFKTKLLNTKIFMNNCDENNFPKEEANDTEFIMKKPICDTNSNNNINNHEQIYFSNPNNHQFNYCFKNLIKNRKSKFLNQISCWNFYNQSSIDNFNCKASENDEFALAIFANNISLKPRLLRKKFYDLKIFNFSISFSDLNNYNNIYFCKELLMDSKDTKDSKFSSEHNTNKNNNGKTTDGELDIFRNFNFNKLFIYEFTRFNEITKTDSFSIINPNYKLQYICEKDINSNYYNYLVCFDYQAYFSFNIKELFGKYIDNNLTLREDINSEVYLNSECKYVLGELHSKITQMQNAFSDFNQNIILIDQYIGSLFDAVFHV